MDNNPVLRAVDNLFSEDTIVIFSYALAFLWCFHALSKKTVKIITNKWVNTLFTAWITIIFLVFVYKVFQNISLYINLMRFGKITNFQVEMVNLKNVVFLPFIFAIIFTFYLWISRNWAKKINNMLIRSIAEGGILLLLSSSIMMLFEILFLGLKTNLTAIATSFAIWIPGTASYALAIIVYNYGDYINKYRVKEKELQISLLQQQLSQSQLDALSAKVNPHFLYNALNSIAGLATTNALKTRDMAIALSKLFRYNINKEESNYVSIKNEMEMVLIYLEIEKIRFEEKLQYTYIVPKEVENELIPRHLLQPLVENAVKHGNGINGVEINIHIEKENKQIMLEVRDSGKPFDIDFNPGYGIKSLYEKLDLLAAKNYEIAFLTDPKAVRITLNRHKN